MKFKRLGFKRLLVSYALSMAMIIIFAMVILYFGVIPKYKKEIIRSNQSILYNYTYSIEESVPKVISSLLIDIITSSYPNYLYHINVNPRNDYWNIYEINNGLINILSKHEEMLNSISIYYIDQEFINSSKGFKFLKQDDNKNMFSYRWLEKGKLEFEKERIFVSSEVVDYNSKEEEGVIVFQKAFPYIDSNNKKMALINFCVKESYIETIWNNFILKSESPNQRLLIYNKNGEQVFGEKSDISSKFGTYLLNNNLEKDKIISKTYASSIVSYIWNSNSDLIYVVDQHKGEYFKDSIALIYFFILAAGATLFIAFYIIYLVSWRNYEPIKEIIEKGEAVVSHFDIEPKIVRDDYGRIFYSLTLLDTFVQENISVIRISFINSLISNRFDKETVIQKAKYLQLTFEYNNFIVVSISTEMTTKLEGWSSIYEYYDSLKLLAPNTNIYMIPKDPHRFAILINYNCMKELNHFKKNLFEAFDSLNVAIVMGPIVSSIYDIWTSYHQSKNMLIYAKYIGSNFFDCVTDYPIDNNNYSLYINKIDLLKDKITSGDGDSVTSICEDIKENIKSERFCISQLKAIIMYYFEMLTNLSTENNYAEGLSSLLILRDKIENYNLCKNINILNDVSSSLYQYILLKKQVVYVEVIGKIVDFIKSNLNENYSLQQLADMFFISYSHLSSLFRKETGMTYPSFVMKQKMNKASSLLLETLLSVDEIASKVGFTDTSYFIKVFKKSFGKTPKFYRLDSIGDSKCTN